MYSVFEKLLKERGTNALAVSKATGISGRFTRAAKRLGITIRFHDLRHFFVSYCHNVLHLSDAQIMRLGGWSSDHIMKRHYLQSMHDQEAADLVSASLSEII